MISPLRERAEVARAVPPPPVDRPPVSHVVRRVRRVRRVRPATDRTDAAQDTEDVTMMRRLVVLDLFSGPGWRDASDMVGHVRAGEAAWLLIEPGAIRVGPHGTGADALPALRDADHGGPSFSCHAHHTTEGPDRPTVHTVSVGDADLYEEILLSVGFRLGPPDGIELQKDETGTFWGYYV